MNARWLLPALLIALLVAVLLYSAAQEPLETETGKEALEEAALEDPVAADAAALSGRSTGQPDEEHPQGDDEGVHPEAPAAEVDDGNRQYVFRDVFDGAVVEVGERERGIVRQSKGALHVAGRWWALRHDHTAFEKPDPHKPAWLVRLVDVHLYVTVQGVERVDPKSVIVSPRLIDTKRAAKAHAPKDAPEEARLGHYAIVPTFEVTRVPETLAEPFHVRIARLRELLLLVSAPGYRQAFAEVPIEDDPERPVVMQVHLEPAPTLRGRVLDDASDIVPGARVELYVKRPAPRDRAVLERWMYGAAWGCSVRGTDEDPYFVFHLRPRLDPKGRFAVAVPVEGEVLIRAKTPEHQIDSIYLGEVHEDKTLRTFRLQRIQDRRTVRVLIETEHGRFPMPTWSVRVRSDDDREASIVPDEIVQIGRDGELPVRAIRAGVRHTLIVPQLPLLLAFEHDGKSGGAPEKWYPIVQFTWNGEEEIVVRPIAKQRRKPLTK